MMIRTRMPRYGPGGKDTGLARDTSS